MYILGASGHCKVIIDIAEQNGKTIEGLVDEVNKTTTDLFGYTVLSVFPQQTKEAFLAVGNNAARKKLSEKFAAFTYPALVHPRATVDKRTTIGEGTVIMAGATLNAAATIGKHCIINTNASVDHDCTLEDFVHISPQAGLAGNVTVGEGTHIGIGASVIQGINIGKWCTIGAGAVIINNVPDGATVVGNPGRII